MNEKLLNVEDAATLLGRTPHAVYQMVSRGQIPYRKAGRRIFFMESELREFIASLPGVTIENLRAREHAYAAE
jgi:excisionase family DNA binding protein